MSAAYAGHVEILQYFITKKANLNVVDENGETALTYACWSNRPKAVTLLVAAGADRNIRTKQGETALDIAQNFSCEEIVHYLRSVDEQEANPAQVKKMTASPLLQSKL
jgi:ankyrin repeat protein